MISYAQIDANKFIDDPLYRRHGTGTSHRGSAAPPGTQAGWPVPGGIGGPGGCHVERDQRLRIRAPPALHTALARLIEAAGSELTLGLRRQPGRLRRLSGPVGHRVQRHRRDLIAAAAAHGVQNLRSFGIVARGEDHLGSDVDLLADMPPGLSLIGLGRLAADLEAILGTRVDLIPATDLKPGARERAEQDQVAL